MSHFLPPNLPPLFCKPLLKDEPLFTQEITAINGRISIRSLNIEKHLPTIHKWVNEPYAKAFWQMDGRYEKLYKTYTLIQENPHAHSYTGFYNEQLICQCDIYMVGADEVRHHIYGNEEQCGMHFIMAPLRSEKIPGLSFHLFSSFLRYYFSFIEAKVMYGEPDHRNEKANELVRKTGFRFLKQIQLSYKKANLFCLTRNGFLSNKHQ